jgi:hypothetical protein
MLDEEVHRVRKPLKQVVNDALRRGLTSASPAGRQRPYRVRPHAALLLPGLDRGRLNALADEQEDVTLVGPPRGRPRS